MADFNKFYPRLQSIEKGFQNSHKDEGNLNSNGKYVGSNFGVTPKIYEQVLGRVPTEADMRAMKPETAKSTIKTVFWDGIVHGNDLASQAIANSVADMSVNSGAAIKLATERLWLTGYPVAPHDHYHDFKQDAIAALNQLDARQESIFLNAYREDRLDYYTDLKDKDEVFKHGWENRVNNNFPIQPVTGWEEVKNENQYFSPRAIELVLFHDDQKKMDGVIGPHTQEALKAFQTEHALEPTGFIDPTTRSLLDWEIRHDETANALGDIAHSRAMLRDTKFELQAVPALSIYEPVNDSALNPPIDAVQEIAWNGPITGHSTSELQATPAVETYEQVHHATASLDTVPDTGLNGHAGDPVYHSDAALSDSSGISDNISHTGSI